MTSASTSDDDTIAYERNVAVMAQVYEKKSSPYDEVNENDT